MVCYLYSQGHKSKLTIYASHIIIFIVDFCVLYFPFIEHLPQFLWLWWILQVWEFLGEMFSGSLVICLCELYHFLKLPIYHKFYSNNFSLMKFDFYLLFYLKSKICWDFIIQSTWTIKITPSALVWGLCEIQHQRHIVKPL